MSKPFGRHMLTSLVLAVSGVALLVPGAQAAPARRPTAGAFRPTRSQLVTSGTLVCVKVRGSWQPATRLRGGWIVTHDQQRSDFARQAARSRGARRRAQLRKAAAWRRKHAQQRPACAKAVQRTARRPSTSVPPPRQSPHPGTPPVDNPPPAPRTPTPLRFDLAGAVGLALPSGSGAARVAARTGGTGSSLIKVEADGAQHDAITSGAAKVRQVVVGPDDAAYVAFNSPVFLEDATEFGAPPGAGCVLARVARANGVPTCVDRSIDWVLQPQWRPSNPTIQFGPGGSVYYLARSGEATVLRRNAGGEITTLVSDHITVDDFLVLPDGSVLVDGWTTSTSATWLRRIVPGGGIQTVENGDVKFLRTFPDGNVYYGSARTVNGFIDFGVWRFQTATNTLDPTRWLGRGSDGPAPHVDLDLICDGYSGPFCGSNGTVFIDGVAVAGSYYAIAGFGTDTVFARYYPGASLPPTDVVRPTQIAPAGATSIALAGADASNRNVLTRFDVVSETEQTLIGPDDEIEIYHLRHQPSSNRLLFDGSSLRRQQSGRRPCRPRQRRGRRDAGRGRREMGGVRGLRLIGCRAGGARTARTLFTRRSQIASSDPDRPPARPIRGVRGTVAGGRTRSRCGSDRDRERDQPVRPRA